MTDEQTSDWEYKIICCLGISTSNSDINVVGLHKTVKELYEQGRADEREAQVCCGDYEKCMEACTPRGRWLAENELAQPKQKPVEHLWECIGRWSSYLALNGEKANLAPPEWLVAAVKAATAQPEQSKYSDIVSDGGLDPRNRFDAQPEQEPVCDKDPFYCLSIRCQVDKVCKHTAPPRTEWVGLTDEEIKEVLGLNEAPWSLSGVALQHVMDDVRALEAKLKEKNNAV